MSEPIPSTRVVQVEEDRVRHSLWAKLDSGLQLEVTGDDLVGRPGYLITGVGNRPLTMCESIGVLLGFPA